jgi:hypothetical protein
MVYSVVYHFLRSHARVNYRFIKGTVFTGSKIESGCRFEMDRHRKLLMDDYRLSPEVVSKCSEDIHLFCRGLARNGKTIHCLLDHSRPRRRNQKIVSAACQRSVSWGSLCLFSKYTKYATIAKLECARARSLV